MRWGIPSNTKDLDLINICSNAIKSCQSTSIGPNFVVIFISIQFKWALFLTFVFKKVLLSERYGYSNLPNEIARDHFNAIHNKLKEKKIDLTFNSTSTDIQDISTDTQKSVDYLLNNNIQDIFIECYFFDTQSSLYPFTYW